MQKVLIVNGVKKMKKNGENDFSQDGALRRRKITNFKFKRHPIRKIRSRNQTFGLPPGVTRMDTVSGGLGFTFSSLNRVDISSSSSDSSDSSDEEPITISHDSADDNSDTGIKLSNKN